MAEPLETSDSVFVQLLLNCIENNSTNKWICTKFVDGKSQKRANIGVIWPLEFFIVFMLRNGKKYSRGKYNSCSRILQISPREETTIFTMLFFSIADVNARKNFACINFVASVDSYRQVKL